MKKHLSLLVLLAVAIPSIVSAAWWNPISWFASSKSDSTSTSSVVSNQQLLERISELEMKVNNQNLVTKASSSTTQNPDNSDTVSQLLSKIDALQTKLASVQSSYSICKNNLAKANSVSSVVTDSPTQVIQPVTTPTQSSVTPTQIDKPFDYTNYHTTNIAYYVKNPKNYLGWGTEIMVGQVNDFLASGDRGVLNNYIEITDNSVGASIPPDKMMVLIDSDQDFKTLASALNKGDVIDVWGIGSPSQRFHSVGSVDSSSSYEPVVTMQRIDKCGSGVNGCKTGNTIFVITH